jgi:ABC-type transporter Mla subunit MlaD
MTSEDRDESIARIEETQDALRQSIERSRRLTEQARQLLARHAGSCHGEQRPDG